MAAVNEVLRKVDRDFSVREMGKITGGLNLPVLILQGEEDKAET